MKEDLQKIAKQYGLDKEQCQTITSNKKMVWKQPSKLSKLKLYVELLFEMRERKLKFNHLVE